MTANTNKYQYTDPVCQMKVAPKSKTRPVTVGSDTYYFCAEVCRDAFISDPDRYLRSKPPKRKGVWGRYLDRLNKATDGKPPCCH